MSKGATLVFLTIVLASCGGEPRQAETIEPQQTARDPTPEQDQPSQAELKAALLRLDDLPAGWTTMEQDEQEDSTSFCRKQTPKEKFPPIEEADADFQKAEHGPFLSHGIGVYEDPDGVMNYFLQVIQECEEWTDTQDGIETTFTLKPLSFPNYGDRTIALRLVGDSDMFTIEGDVVVWRRDDIVSLIVQLAIGGVDSAQTETFVQKADSKL